MEARTNAERQAEYRKRMKAAGFTARLIWLPKKARTPTPVELDRLREGRRGTAGVYRQRLKTGNYILPRQ